MLATSQNRFKPEWLFDCLFLALLFGAFYALWIGGHALFTPDEGRYSEVAREMVVSGDYITPRVNGVAFLDKPVLYYWLQASAILMFGVKEWALRFWPAVAGVLGCIITYLTGRIIFNRRTAIVSAMILATSPLYYGAAHYANLDLEVATLIGNSLLCFLAAMQFPLGRSRDGLLFAAYVFGGLAFLTKGLIGLAFPGLIIGTWVLILRRWSVIKTMRIIPGLLIFACIATPWYYLVQKANPEFLHFFFVTQQVSRFLTQTDFNNKAAFWFYFPVVLGGFFPWSIFIIQAVAEKISNVWHDKQQHANELFLLLWLFIIFTFFSIPHSKTVGYILPIFPSLALLTGNYLSNQWERVNAKGIKLALLLFSLANLCIASAFFVIPMLNLNALRIIKGSDTYLMIAGILLLISTVVLFFFRNRKTLMPLFVGLFVTGMALLLTFSASLHLITQKSVKPLALQIKALMAPGDEVVTYHKYFQDLPIYVEQRITIVEDWNSPKIPYNDNWVRELWYGMVFQDTKEWLINDNTFWQRWNSEKHLFVLANIKDFPELEAKTNHIYKLAEYNNVVLVTNFPITTFA